MTTTIRTLQRSFAGGEVAPELYGRVDLAKHQTGLALSRNMQPLPHGPVQSRAGFKHVLRTKDPTAVARLIEFAYNTEQTYVVELGNLYARFHTNSGTLLGAAQNISAITKANPGVLTYAGADFTNGQWVYLTGIGGMTELNGRWAIVANVNAGANTFELTDLDGVNINTTNYTTYTAGGTVSPIVELATPYITADLFDIHYTQSADTMTLVHPDYQVRELSRLSATSWSLDVVSFDNNIAAPTGLAVDTHAGSALTTERYAVFAFRTSGSIVSTASPEAKVRVNRAGTSVTLRWPAVQTNVDKYIIARWNGSAWKELARTADSTVLSYTDSNTADGSTVTPSASSIFRFRGPKALTAETVTTDPNEYVITALSAGFLEESDPSDGLSVDNDLTAAGAYNVLTWDPVTSAVRYIVYKRKNGLFGYIGETTEVEFKDDNITPDLTRSPVEGVDPFQATDTFPGAVGYFQGRRFFGGSTTDPQALYGTRAGTESNMTYAVPSNDADAIRARIAARNANVIRHFVPLRDLLILTSGAEWLARSADNGPLTPDSIQFQVQGYVGASQVQPVVTNTSVLYAQDRGGRISELRYALEQDGYAAADVSVMAPHLFDGYTIVQMALQRSPHQTIWCVRSDGTLLGCTYLPEHEVLAWHQHTTDGTFESVACVAEGDYDAVYVVVNRSINGNTVRFVERLADRDFASREDSFCVDCGLTYDGAAASSITGLWHLEGEEVAVLADGAVHPAVTVTDGSITLEADASVVHVGLAMPNPRGQTLPLAYEAQAAGQHAKKNVNKVYLRLVDSGGVFAGPDFDNMKELKVRTTQVYGDPPGLQNGLVELQISPSWSAEGQVCFEQQDPLPLTVSSMILEVVLGG